MSLRLTYLMVLDFVDFADLTDPKGELIASLGFVLMWNFAFLQVRKAFNKFGTLFYIFICR